MGKSKKQKQQVNEYRMSIHFGGVVRAHALRAVFVDDKEAWRGRQVGSATLSVNNPNAFGGPKEQGGLVGSIYYLPGGATQVLPDTLAARLGGSPTSVVGYRAFTSLWFTGTETSRILGDYGDGLFGQVLSAAATASYSASTASGFTWSANNPIIAQAVDAVYEYCPTNDEFPLVDAHARIPNSEAPDSWPDANPAHIIYAILVDRAYGLGTPPALIDTTSFTAAAATLFNESFGLSFIRTDRESGEAVISDVLDHISGSLYDDPATGLKTLKLFRADYDVNALVSLTPENSRIVKAGRTQGHKLINEVVVRYTNPNNEEELSLTRQNLAIFDTQGQINSVDRDFYAIRNGELANRVCERELTIVSTPLLTAEVEVVDPSIQPLCFVGAVFRVAHPLRKVDGIVARVLSVSPPTASNPLATLEVVEDVFGLQSAPVLSAPPLSQWVAPDQEPSVVTDVLALTTPYFWETADGVVPAWPAAHPLILAAAPSLSSPSYDLLEQKGAGYSSVGLKDFIARATVVNAMPPTAGAIPKGLWGDAVTAPAIGDYLFTTNEIMRVSGDNANNWLLDRGLLDTAPSLVPAGSLVWVVKQPERFVEDSQERLSGEQVTYRALSRTARGQLSVSSAPNLSVVVSDRPHRPLRPANPLLNGVLPGESVGTASQWVLTWATRNRLLEQGTPVLWSAGAVTPEFKQRTIIRVRDQATNAVVYENQSLWVENATTLQRAWFDRYAAVLVSILSEREGLESFIEQSWAISGLPANAGAPPPPANPLVSPAPSPVPAPSASSFSVAAGTTTSPSIVLTGSVPASIDATGILLRYSSDGHSGEVAAIAINTDYTGVPRPVTYEVSPLRERTVYNVSIAFTRQDGTASEFVHIGSDTTGALTASPQSANLVAGGGPYKSAIPRGEFLGLGVKGDNWRAVSIESELAQAAWSCAISASSGYQSIEFVPFEASANKVYSVQYVAAKIGSWTSGSIQAGIKWVGVLGQTIRLDELPLVEDGVQNAMLPSGYRVVQVDGLPPAPNGTVFGSLFAVVTGKGVGAAHFLRAKVNLGGVAAPYSDEATSAYLLGSRLDGGITDDDGNPIERIDLLNQLSPRIEGPVAININANYLNETLPGQIGEGYVLAYRLMSGDQNIGLSGPWSVRFFGPITGYTTVTGALVITSADGEGSARVTAPNNKSLDLTISRTIAAPPLLPALSGAALDATSEILSVLTRQAAGFDVISRELKVTTGLVPARTRVSFAGQFDTSLLGGSSTAGVNVGLQYRLVGGTWVTIAEIVDGGIQPLAGVADPTTLEWYHNNAFGGDPGRNDNFEPETAQSGSVKVSVIISGITQLLEHEFRLIGSLQSSEFRTQTITWFQSTMSVKRL
jgi:hypothetical protein